MTRYFVILILGLVNFVNVDAQDPHFSQYHAVPLALNPAMTGYFNEDFRINGEYRQQWWAGGTPFTTGTMSVDFKLLQSKIKSNDVFSVGFLGLYDQSLGGGYRSTNLSTSFAYHKSMDAADHNNLGIGFQLTYASRSVNPEGLTFANQFNGAGFDTNIPSNETFSSMHSNYFDVNTGLLYNYKTEKLEIYAGSALFHIGRPKVGFLKNDDYRLPMRYSANAGARINSGKNGNEFFISGIFMYQAGATEKNIGVAYGFNINDNVEFLAGTWYRFNEAIIPYLGLNYNNLKIGLSYDVINSDIKVNNPKDGSFELSFSILGKKPINKNKSYKRARVL